MGCDLDHGVGCNCGGSAAIADRTAGPTKSQSEAFVEFVLRHTWPARFQAHGAKVVHDLIKHHPFAKMFAPPGIEFKSPDATAEGLLREAASKFRFYQSQHEQKYRALEAEIAEMEPDAVLIGAADKHREKMRDTHEKARANHDIAARIEKFLNA